MNPQNPTDRKALVTVLDDIETAQAIVEKLHDEGYSLDKVEIITHDVRETAPEIETPSSGETMEGSMIKGGIKGAQLGAGIGLLGAVFAPFPGVGLAMIAMGGLVGGAFGSIAGADEGRADETVDLPKVSDYEKVVQDGYCLVVVLGNHDEVHRAEAIVETMPFINSHLHKLDGHEFHEHPSRDER